MQEHSCNYKYSQGIPYDGAFTISKRNVILPLDTGGTTMHAIVLCTNYYRYVQMYILSSEYAHLACCLKKTLQFPRSWLGFVTSATSL
jgi:hypothetical protein